MASRTKMPTIRKAGKEGQAKVHVKRQQGVYSLFKANDSPSASLSILYGQMSPSPVAASSRITSSLFARASPSRFPRGVLFSDGRRSRRLGPAAPCLGKSPRSGYLRGKSEDRRPRKRSVTLSRGLRCWVNTARTIELHQGMEDVKLKRGKGACDPSF